MRPSLVIATLIIALGGCVSTEEPPAQDGSRPLVVGAVGHSLMNGFNADQEHQGIALDVAWPTAEAPWSFASRMGADASARENRAIPGAHSRDFVAQVETIENATFVVVGFVDANLCAGLVVGTGGSPGEDTFEADMRAGVQALVARNITPLLTTVPDLVSLAEAGRTKVPTDPSMAPFYGVAQECGADPQYREKAAAMNALVMRIADEEGALHDAGAFASIAWTPEMVSDLDGLHPSPAGQEAIASAVWEAYAAQREVDT